MMLRLLFKFIPSFVLAFAMLNVSARALGTRQPANPAMQGFVESCEDRLQPCWYGVVLEETTRRDVSILTRRLEYTPQNEVFSGSIRIYSYYTLPLAVDGCDLGVAFDMYGIVVDYRLHDCQGIYVGDVIRQYGLDGVIAFGKGEQVTVEYTFPDAPYKIVFSLNGNLRPLNRIEDMEIYPADIRLASVFVWHGFAPQRHYCQLEPLNLTCS